MHHKRQQLAGVSGLLVVGLALTGCVVESDATVPTVVDPEVASVGLETDFGVTDDTITLASMSDQSGVFAALGNTLVQGNQLYFDQRNAEGGICGRQVELVVRDHGSDTQTAITQFNEISPSILGLVQLLGSPQTNALLTDLESNQIPTFPASWSSDFLGSEPLLIAGTLYPVEVINGWQHLVDEGLLAAGDTVGHIHFPGDFGENALKGSVHFGAEAGVEVLGIQVEPSATDLTAQVTEMADAGVSAIFVSAGPRQTASVAAVSASLGLTVPILGNGPAFDPALLETPAADALIDRLYVSVSYAPFASDSDEAQAIQSSYAESFPDTNPTIFVNYGYAVASIFGQGLDAACAAGDMTRAGVVSALRSLTNVQTGIFPPLSFADISTTTSDRTYVLRVDPDVPGGLVIGEDLFSSPYAATYSD